MTLCRGRQVGHAVPKAGKKRKDVGIAGHERPEKSVSVGLDLGFDFGAETWQVGR